MVARATAWWTLRRRSAALRVNSAVEGAGEEVAGLGDGDEGFGGGVRSAALRINSNVEVGAAGSVGWANKGVSFRGRVSDPTSPVPVLHHRRRVPLRIQPSRRR